MTEWTAESLIAFEDDIAARFARAEIPYPVHLDGGNEEQLVSYFRRHYTPGDWVCGAWRMHYKCLLAGVPEEELRTHILAGNSITLCFPEYKIISSALVGHICPIAMGIAYSKQKVHCFVGDMSAQTGLFKESLRYAQGWNLPIVFIIENNRKSVTTDTMEVWGEPNYLSNFYELFYTPKWPHQGIGKRVEF